jgi:hypothetical protein
VTILVTGTDPCFATLEADQPVRSGISADLLAALDLLNLGILVIDGSYCQLAPTVRKH